ncbi:MAG: YciI family protein [Anaerolineales bacterium]
MQYLCLIYYNEKRLENLPEAERNALYEEAYAYYDELVKNGYGIAGDALQPVQQAMSIRINKDKTYTTDGPYIETKEQVGGFILMEAKDLEEAIRLASNIPPARLGGVEVRPVWNMAAR